MPTSFWYLRWFDLAAVDHVDFINVMSMFDPIHTSAGFTTDVHRLRVSDMWNTRNNLLSYILTIGSLHGTWDSTNPIGSHVYAHTNLTEIKQAFDLFWRNSVPPNKLNLGIGFYGRSFQLSDPSCYTPGCNFLGGASPGPVIFLS